MNCTPESLHLLWKWFLQRAETESVVYVDEEKHNNKISNSIWRKEKQLTLETEYILRDIGMYLGETFRKNHPNIYWTYYTKPRKDFFVNHPILKGFVDRTFNQPFEACFEPIHMAKIQATKVMDKTAKTVDLLNLYSIWAEKTYG